MRVLIVDECMAPGGVETLRLNLIPELAKLCESLVWALPLPYGQALRERILQRKVPNLAIENLLWSRGSVHQLQNAVLRRLSGTSILNGPATRLMRKSTDLRIRKLAKKHRSVCCLTTFVFSQPPPVSGLPLAGFVCDVNPVLPEWVRDNIVRWASAGQATFGISEFTSEALRLLAPESAAKIHAIPIAAPPLTSLPSLSSESQSDFYFPATANPHKGHLTLFQACLALSRRGVRFTLVLSGPGTENFLVGGQFDAPAMKETRDFLERNRAELNGCVTIAGDLPRAKVDALYASTRCVVLPSRYEGFGLPLVEALQRGKDVLCSDIPPFREQLIRYEFFDRVKLVPLDDAGRLADAMEEMLKKSSVPIRDPDETGKRLARWTWTDVAARCYEHLHAISGAEPADGR
jgi:glycosyltransferase involved in cell wall biosynthesis